MPAAILQAAFQLTSTPKEGDATAAVSKHVQALGLELWGLGHKPMRGKGLSQYDLGWAPKGPTEPTVYVQVKSGGIHQEDQSVLELLNDVVFAAHDKMSMPLTGALYACVTVLHPEKKNRNYWPTVAALTGRCLLSLTPSAAKEQHGAKANTWIDIVSKTITPYTRTQFGQIFSGTQKAKYVGLFVRPGTLTVEIDAQVISAGLLPHKFDVSLLADH